MRQTGIDVVGEAPWGSHLCLFYETPEDLLDVLVPYFERGLANNEFCTWVTSDPVGVDAARQALARAVPRLDRSLREGRIEILDYRQWYAPGGRFNGDRVLRAWAEKEQQALERGFEGLRITGNTFWVRRRRWKPFAQYEAAIDGAIRSRRMLVLCAYSTEQCGCVEVADVVNSHQFAMVRRGGRWQVIENRRHREVEEALRRSRDELDARVRERTADLARTVAELERRTGQLRALALDLTQAEQRERRRLAHLLHDHLQQLLVGAKFSIGVVKGRAKTKNLRQAAQQVDDLLDEAIKESRSLTHELSPPVLYDSGLPKAIEWLARQMHEKHGLVVSLDVAGEIEPLADPIRVLLFEAVRELLFNTVKHARTHRAIVALARAGGDRVQVVVADEGAGFDPKVIEVRAAEGGGFGLFTIRERLELLGGRFEVVSAPGGGSRFTLVAPVRHPSRVAEVEAPEEDETAPSPHYVTSLLAPDLAAGRGAKIRVLLADDHKVMRQGLARLLQEQPDIEVIAQASDGRRAVELARQVRPDVVILDVSMPRMNGIEAARLLKQEMPDVRVIGLSMHDEADMAAAMCEAGAVAYLNKADRPEALLVALRSCVSPLADSPAAVQ